MLFVFASIQNVFAGIESSNEDAKTLKAFVESGIDYINKYGTKKAYTEFNSPKGKFKQGELYLFAYNFDGTCLAHGSTISRVGKKFNNERDKYGTPVIKLLSELAKAGGGFASYYWPEPDTNKIQLKTAYVKSINKNSYLGSGYYKALDVPKDQVFIKIEEVKAFINTGIEYYKEHGAQAAFKEFINPNGAFRIGDMYLFVLNSKGVMLAEGANLELVGKNLYDIKDDFGTPFVQLLIQIAKDGGRSVSYYWQQPSTKQVKLKVCYIIPLDSNTYIGSGFYGD
jgi:signal transduction histidine kinase